MFNELAIFQSESPNFTLYVLDADDELLEFVDLLLELELDVEFEFVDWLPLVFVVPDTFSFCPGRMRSLFKLFKLFKLATDIL